MKRSVFYISDSTGITVEALGHSVLAQFDGVEFLPRTLSFIDTPQKAQKAVQEINSAAQNDRRRPIIFCTFADDGLMRIIAGGDGLTMDCLEIFIRPLEEELKIQASHTAGRSHSTHGKDYQRRIDALNFTMNHDDGASLRQLDLADIILLGVSRSGKTPTSLYLALNYGVFAANYPLVDEDLTDDSLPAPLRPHLAKLYGLTISPRRLAQIRQQRRPDSRYAQAEKCAQEVRAAQNIFAAAGVHFLDVTHRSIEELASKILKDAKLPRR